MRRFVEWGIVVLALCAGTVVRADALVVDNARVFGGPKTLRTLYVRDGRFVEKLAVDAGARHLDAKGAWVIPGFVDAHAHLISGGQMLERVQLDQLKTREQVIAAVSQFAREHSKHAWILGGRWRYDAFGKRPPTLAELDRAVPDRPAFLESYDGHSAWVNSRALKAAKINPRMHSGLLLEQATAAVEAKIPSSVDEKKRAIRAAASKLHAAGVTTVYEAGLPLADLAIFEELERELPIRVVFGANVTESFSRVAAAKARVAWRSHGKLFVGASKGFVDGVIESGTACMIAPFADGSGPGRAPMIDRTVLVSQMRRAADAEIALAYHAVGDGAARAVLEALATIDEGERPRVRLEHMEIADATNLERMRALDVIASMMPQHATPGAEATGEGVWIRRVGKAREPHAFAFASVLKAGVSLAFGSDWPVATFDPFYGIATAVTRQNEDGTPKDAWLPEQRISVGEAVRAYTEGAANAVGLEREVGRIAPGYRADFVLIDGKRALTDGRAWFGVRPLRVVVDGKLENE